MPKIADLDPKLGRNAPLMIQLPGQTTQSLMAVKAEMVVMTMINILEKFDEDELALMMNDQRQGWEDHEMKSESPKQQQQVQK